MDFLSHRDEDSVWPVSRVFFEGSTAAAQEMDKYGIQDVEETSGDGSMAVLWR